MSKMTSAHNHLIRCVDKLHLELAPQHGVDTDRVEMRAYPVHYEKRDGYRTINLTANNKEYLREIGKKLAEMAKTLKQQVYVNIELSGSARSPKEHLLMVYVNYYAGDPLKIESRL